MEPQELEDELCTRLHAETRQREEQEQEEAESEKASSEESENVSSNSNKKKKRETGENGSSNQSAAVAAADDDDQIVLLEVVRARIDGSFGFGSSEASNQDAAAAPDDQMDLLAARIELLPDEKKKIAAARLSPVDAATKEKTTTTTYKKEKKEGAEPAAVADGSGHFDILDVVRARATQGTGGSQQDSLSLSGAYATATTTYKKEKKEGAEPAAAADGSGHFDILDVVRARATQGTGGSQQDSLSLPGAYAAATTTYKKKKKGGAEPAPMADASHFDIIDVVRARTTQGAGGDSLPLPGAHAAAPGESLQCPQEAALPGAYAQAPEAPGSLQSLFHSEESSIAEASAIDEDSIHLSEAMAIDDASIHLPNMEAQPVDLEASQRKRDQQEKQKNLFVAISAFLVCLAVAVILLLFLLGIKQQGGSKPDGEGSGDIAAPTVPPSLPPTPFSISSFVLDLLPEETQWVISRQEDSPQAEAYEWMLQDPNVTDYENWRIVQRFALATLFLATNGYSWSRNTHWLSHDKHECEWYISPSFAMKESLGVLYPGYMNGLDPPKQNCYQDNDQDNSTTTSSSSSGMNGKYQNLWLDRNSLDGKLPKELYLLTNLQTLSITYNKLDGGGRIPSQIGQLTHLQGLAFNTLQNAGSMPTEIGLLTNLRGIVLNQFTGTVPTEYHSLTKLESIVYFNNPQLSGPIMPFFHHYPNLAFLAMEGCAFTGTIPTEIGQLQSLQFFALNTNRVTGTLPTEVGLLTNLGVLFSMPENSMTGTLPTELGLLTSAKFLGLRDNLFSGTIPSELGLVRNAASLSFEGNEMEGTIPTELGEMKLLFDLSFEQNAFSGPIPSEFGSLTALRRLNLGNNSLTGTIPEELTAIMNPKLYALDVSGNPLLSGMIPQALCNINGTCTAMALKKCDDIQGLIFDCQNLLCGCNCPCNSLIGNNNATLPKRQDSPGSLR